MMRPSRVRRNFSSRRARLNWWGMRVAHDGRSQRSARSTENRVSFRIPMALLSRVVNERRNHER